MVTVAVDAAPMLGRPTGVGVAVGGLLSALSTSTEPSVVGYGLTGTGWRQLSGVLPATVRPGRGPMPAAVLLRLWGHLDIPPAEWWTGPVDVVHGTNYVVPPSRRAVRLVTVHDLTPVRFPELCSPSSLRYPGLVRRAIAAGADVHAPAQAIADEICEHFRVDAARVHVVGWGVRQPLRPASPGRRGAVRGPPYVLGLGTVEPRKDFPLLVAAFDEIAGAHPDLRLRIVGPAGWGEEALRRAVDRSPHRDRIDRVGWVADPSDDIAGAAVFAFPSVYEGFGFPPLEAMALDVPVVATAAGAVPEVVGEAATLVPTGDTVAFAAAITRILDDDDHRRRLVAAGRARVADFGWAAAGERFRRLYETLAGRG